MSAGPTPDPPTDAALAAAYRRADERAATELVRRYAGALSRFLCASGAPASDVEDLVQETFFRAFRGLEGWRGEGSLRGWLFTIGGNLLRDEFRKRKGRRMLSLEDRDVPDHADPYADLAASEAEQRVREGLAACRGFSAKCSCSGYSRGPGTRRSRPRSAPRPARPACTITTP